VSRWSTSISGPPTCMPPARTASMRGINSAFSSMNCAPGFTYGMRHTSVTLRSIKFRDAIDDKRKLVARQVLMHGQRDRRIGVTVRHWKVSPFVSKMAQSLLAVERNRIMVFTLVGTRCSLRHHCVAPFDKYLIGSIAVQHTRIARRNPDLLDGRQCLIVKRGICPALVRDPLGLIEHVQGDDRLDRVEPAVDAQRYDHVAALQTVVAQQGDAFCDIWVVRSHNAAIAPDVDELERMQRKSANHSP